MPDLHSVMPDLHSVMPDLHSVIPDVIGHLRFPVVAGNDR